MSNEWETADPNQKHLNNKNIYLDKLNDNYFIVL